MATLLIAIGAGLAFIVAYHTYGRWLGSKIFRLSADAICPSERLKDGVDYVPTSKSVVFGHHFTSIAGTGPIVGPAIAIMWGWVPALLWVVLGSIFIGAVHDFGALVVSLRNNGQTVGDIAGRVLNKRVRLLFLFILFMALTVVLAIFGLVIAAVFKQYPAAIFPCVVQIPIAITIGVLLHRKGVGLLLPSLIALAVMYLTVVFGNVRFLAEFNSALAAWPIWTWVVVLLGYSYVASVLPVWTLLQPRDYINSLLLYVGLISIFAGFFVLRPQFAAPVLEMHPEGAPPLFPFVFIVIACSAISGFHGLVSSGTTAKQINSENDARLIGYGGMIGESLLGLVSVLACTAGFASTSLWRSHYQSWSLAQGLGPNMKAFIDGSGHFLSQLGVPLALAKAFVALVAISFALTTLDSGVRLLRFNITEMSETLRIPILKNRYLASALAVLTIGFFAFYKIGGRAAGLALWQLFGTTNQVLGALTLLAITLYLMQRGRNYWFTAIPMVFMMVTTLVAMTIKMRDFWNLQSYVLLSVGAIILGLSLWLAVESVLRVVQGRRPGRLKVERLE